VRILHVIHSLDPESGGPSHALRGMVRVQAARGDRVHVLATSIQSTRDWLPARVFKRRMERDFADLGASVELVRALGRCRPWSRFAYSPGAARQLRTRLTGQGTGSEHADVVHVHGLFSHLTSLAAAVARRAEVAHVIRPAGGLDPACLSLGGRRLKQLYLRLSLERDLRAAPRLHATSDLEARVLASWTDPTRVSVVPHGVDVPEVDAARARASLLRRAPALGDRRTALFLGRLHPKKRPAWAVEALALLKSDVPDLALVFAGQDAGALRDVWTAARRHHLLDRVVHLGFLQGETKEEILTAADAFVLPSTDENFGVAAVEALAHGTPAVVTRGVASHRYVVESGGGRCVDDDVEALATGLRETLAGSAELGRRGREYVTAHLTWETVAEQLDAMYNAAITTAAGAAL